MGKHKNNAEGSAHISNSAKAGYATIAIRSDHVIFVEPVGYITGPIVQRMLDDLKHVIDTMRQQHRPVRILINIGRISGHTSESRSMVKHATQLGFDKGAAYGGSVALGMIMQY